MKIGTVVKVLNKESLDYQDLHDFGEFSNQAENAIMESKGVVVDIGEQFPDYPYVVEIEVVLPIKYVLMFSEDEIEEV
jgi:hypothetical protein